MITNTRTRRAAVGVAALLTAVAGCGSDGPAEVADDATDSAEEAVDDLDDGQSDLVDALRDEGLSSVATALETIDISQLTDSEEFTFLAPNDEAFQALDADQVADLMADPQKLLETLRNHTIPQRYLADDLADVRSVETEAGQTLEVTSADGAVTFGPATVVSSDVDVADGVVHVVDRLIIP